MVYRRPNRRTFTFQGRTQTGWKQIGTHTKTKSLAAGYEAMWERLAERREWELLGRVTSGEMKVGTLYDLWTDSAHNPVEMKRLLSDTDLEPLVDEFLAVHKRGVKPDTLAHVEHHVRTAIPKGRPFLASEASTDRLTSILYAYPGKQNTLRKVHSDLSVFFEYCSRVKRLFPKNPMDDVARPSVEKSPVRFYELDTVERIVGAQPNLSRRALFALMYGTSIEVTIALALTRADVDLITHDVRAAGTKAHNRDRMCRVADWAWPIVEQYVSDKLPTAPLWPVTTRWTVSDWHRQTVIDLELPKKYPLMCARHHWAVRAARAGTPIAVIQNQLGHGSPMLTLTLYGQFLPSASDRQKWETEATNYETKRRATNE